MMANMGMLKKCISIPYLAMTIWLLGPDSSLYLLPFDLASYVRGSPGKAAAARASLAQSLITYGNDGDGDGNGND
jgi:hypothetical protein